MAAKTANPARGDAAGPGLGVVHGKATDFSGNITSEAEVQARQFVEEMLGEGAQFFTFEGADGRPRWRFELPGGGDLTRCRAIIREAKRSAATWEAFVGALLEEAKR